jgi:hypothetical protein
MMVGGGRNYSSAARRRREQVVAAGEVEAQASRPQVAKLAEQANRYPTLLAQRRFLLVSLALHLGQVIHCCNSVSWQAS